jgi:hypothetical protein
MYKMLPFLFVLFCAVVIAQQKNLSGGYSGVNSSNGSNKNYGVVLHKSTIPQATLGLDSGLVAYYPFNGNTNDASGNGFNGTDSGATLTTDRFGNANSAYYFNGNSYIAYPDVFMENINSFTFSVWFNINAFPSSVTQSLIVYKGTLHGEVEIAISTLDTIPSLIFSVHLANGNWYTCAAKNILLNKVYHVIGRYTRGSEIDICVNDSLMGTTSIPSYNLSTAPGIISSIGAYNGNWLFFTGTIDDIRIYNRAITNAEIQALYQQGGWPLKTPHLISVTNVPYDQGGKVELIWQASSLDTNVDSMPYYSIWRALPQTTQGNSVGTYAWAWLANQPAHKDSLYSYTALTLNDSMAGNNAMEYFMVSAQTNDPNVFYNSNIDSGYSLDNLAPLPPDSLTEATVSGKVVLQWHRSVEPDLYDYVVYRSDSSITDPNKINPYDTTSDIKYTDMHPLLGKLGYYLVRAEDKHGNLSNGSNQISVNVSITGVENQQTQIPNEYNLEQNYPNPFNPSTIINYAVPKTSLVTIIIYDVLGREVRTIVNEERTAGNYSVQFNAGNLASGIYFYRIQAGSFVQTKKLILLK